MRAPAGAIGPVWPTPELTRRLDQIASAADARVAAKRWVTRQ